MAMMAFTVVPLHNLNLPIGTRIPFGAKFVVQDVPEWLKKDTAFLADIAEPDRAATLKATQAFVSDYDAPSLGHPDPEWKGQKPRSMQDLRFQSAILANMGMWLVQPSTVSFTVGFHALTILNGRALDTPIPCSWQREEPIRCHPRDKHNPLEPKHMLKAAKLYEVLSTVPRNNSLWEALRAASAAISTCAADRRYAHFWMALEALFGREKRDSQLTRKLARRLVFSIADNHPQAQNIHDMVLRCYDMRCKIVHGRWDNDPAIDSVMHETEAIIRTAFRVIADDPKLLAHFASPRRDTFLSQLVDKRAKKLPPLVEPAAAKNHP